MRINSIDRNMVQGALTNTGKPLDMAIEGNGYFVLNDGQTDVYTRMGSFAVDANFDLVDPASGYRVQRIGSIGVDDGFQTASTKNIRIPYDVALPANETSSISMSGNLSADDSALTTTLLSGGVIYTVNSGQVAAGTDTIDQLDQASGIGVDDDIRIRGVDWDPVAETATAIDTTIAVHTGVAYKTLATILTEISALFTNATAVLANGDIRLIEDSSGYTQTDIRMDFVPDAANPDATLTTPSYFEMLEAGGEASRETSIEMYDTQGISHVLSGVFVRQGNSMWDFVAMSISGEIAGMAKRRVTDITFSSDGAYVGVSAGENRRLEVEFPADVGNPQIITLDLGTNGEYDGLSQFGGASTATAATQDGFASGWLSSLSVSREGVLEGTFTNGQRKDIAAIKLATFQNASALQSLGGNYFEASANSGEPQETQGLVGGTGAVTGGGLEGSNTDVAGEFVAMIQAQNGFQANARTIRVANDMLKELTNLIR